ncbi:MAG: hypothetical protein WAM53_07530 [Terrimicrobiaceae bacterium]
MTALSQQETGDMVKVAIRYLIALLVHETVRSNLAVVRLCGTQQTIDFAAWDHDPSTLCNRFDCAPVELAVAPSLMFPKQGCKFSRRIRYTVVERRLLIRFVVLFHAPQNPSAVPEGCSIRDAIEDDRLKSTTLCFYMFVQKAGKAAEKTDNQRTRQPADFLLVASFCKHLQSIKKLPFPIKSLLLYH